MPRRILPILTGALCLTLLLLGGPGLLAQEPKEDLTVWKTDLLKDVTPKKMVNGYLMAHALVQFETRREALKLVKTSEDLRKRQEELRSKFIEALGGFPEKTPLNAKTIGSLKGEGFRVELVMYESRPNHHVTANLYLPLGRGPFPAVLVPCGHTANGKAGYQRVCIILAQNGIAALCYDPIGQGERYQILQPPGKPVTGSTNEHTLVGISALLVGQCAASYRVWDGIRSIDYLTSRPDIDPKRIGCTGSSGGGTLTSYLMALDDRIAAAAPSCYITSLEKLFATIGPQDAEQNIPGQVAFGMEHADYLTLRAPRPTLILCATRDFFRIEGTWDTFREAKRTYGVAGFGERVDLFEFDTTHGYPKQQREAMVRFMRRWLLGVDDAVVEGDYATFKDQELQCTRTGQVIEDLKGKSVFDLIAEKERELVGHRAKFQSAYGPDDLRKEIRRFLGVPETVKLAGYKELGDVKRDGYYLVKLIMETEPGILVPGLLFSPKKEGPVPLIVYLNGDGKTEDCRPGGRCEQLVKAGNRVLALDLRGLGETSPGGPQAKPTYFGSDFRESFLAMHLNRPLLGQRVYDVLTTIEYLDQNIGKLINGFEVIGIGTCGPVALHAAALDPRIKRVTVEKSVVSWSAVAKTAQTYNQLTNVVPGVLKVYDLPDLATMMAPRPLTLRGLVDAAGKPVPQATLDDVYRSCRMAYQQQKAEKSLLIQSQ